MPKSYPWPGVVGGTGAGADSGRYNAPEWWAVWAAQQQAGGLIVPDVAAPLRTLSAWANIGVYYGIPNQLEVTDGGGFVADVDTGGALVDGQFFYEDEGRSLTMPASQTYYVVVRKNYTAAAYSPPGYAAGDGIVPAYTSRITWVAALVQSTDRTTYWDIPLATVVTDGVEITSVTDTRDFIENHVSADGFIMVPDSLSVAGNARGNAAVDLQQARNNAAEVASGDYATIPGGRANTASGDGSYAEGVGNEAAGENSHAEGNGTTASGEGSHVEGISTDASDYAAHAEGNGTLASGYVSHAEGENTIASGDYSHAEGEDTEASGIDSHAEGYNTEASGSRSHAEGSTSIASGASSHAEGSGSTASGDYAHAGGSGGYATMHGQFSRTGGPLSGVGTTQYNDFHIRDAITHSTANWYPLYLDGISLQILLRSDSALTFDVLLVGTTQGCTKTFSFRIVGCIENDGGTTTMLASTTTTIYDTDDVSFDAQAVADNATDALEIQVQDTDAGGNVVHWSAVVRTAEVRYAS